MTVDIISKISEELRRGIDSEAQVLYLLVQIRKVRQADLISPKTFLDFYRDWACHVQISSSTAVSIFFDRFESLVDPTLNAHELAKNFATNYPSFFKLDELKTELRNFLVNKGLITELTDSQSKWHTFVKHLLNILADCSIKRTDPIQTKTIRELTLSVNDLGDAEFKFRLEGRRDIPICKLKWK